MIRKFTSFVMFSLFFAQCLFAQPQKQKIILDTDLGGDIDDAFALALILCSPEFEVLGFVMDHGLTQERARIACKMLYETGHENIPVVVGRQTPLIIGQDEHPAPYNDQFYWARGFDRIKPIDTPAQDFIIDNLRKYPDEIILFTVGPVPNIADVIRKDPEALKLAKHIYSMFGSFYIGYGGKSEPDAEWNVRADVESAKRFASCGAKITYAGLDITAFVTLEESERYKLLMRQSPLTDALCGLYSLWGKQTPILFDCVAVGMALWPDLFTTHPAHIQVTDTGYTEIDENKTPTCEVGVYIDKETFLRRLMQRLLQQNFSR